MPYRTLALLLASSFALAQAPAHPEMLVSTQWLADHAKDPDLVILQISDEKKDYDRGHIPGARWLPYSEIIVDHSGSMGVIPPLDQVAATLSRLGVSDKSHVVVYTTDWYPYAARVYYTLDYLGHGGHTSVLDGGILTWKHENRALETSTPQWTPATFTPHITTHVQASFEEAQAATAASSKTVLLDARPEKRYTAAHLPGAQHLYWRDTVVDEKENPVLLPPDKLRALLAAQHITPDTPVITYCEVGYQASHDYFIAKYLGYNAEMYDGSFYEWNDMKKQPVIKGDQPR